MILEKKNCRKKNYQRLDLFGARFVRNESWLEQEFAGAKVGRSKNWSTIFMIHECWKFIMISNIYMFENCQKLCYQCVLKCVCYFFFVHPSLCTSFKQIDFDIESTLSIQKIPIDNTIANILLVPFNHEKCSNPKEKMQEEYEYK